MKRYRRAHLARWTHEVTPGSQQERGLAAAGIILRRARRCPKGLLVRYEGPYPFQPPVQLNFLGAAGKAANLGG